MAVTAVAFDFTNGFHDKIVLASLAGGAGVVVAFGLVLLGLSRARRSSQPTTRLANFALSGVAGLFCLAAVVLGIYAMTKKPATAKPKPKAAALVQRVAA